MSSDRRAQSQDAEALDSAGRTEPQPPSYKTLDKLLSEIQDAVERDQQFLLRADECLGKWKVIARQMQDRFRELLGGDQAK